MEVLLVGADNLGVIDKRLAAYGVASIAHVTGRNVMERRRLTIPAETALVIVLTDFVCHRVALSVKKRAKQQGVPIIFVKRSWVAIEEKIRRLAR